LSRAAILTFACVVLENSKINGKVDDPETAFTAIRKSLEQKPAAVDDSRTEEDAIRMAQETFAGIQRQQEKENSWPTNVVSDTWTLNGIRSVAVLVLLPGGVNLNNCTIKLDPDTETDLIVEVLWPPKFGDRECIFKDWKSKGTAEEKKAFALRETAIQNSLDKLMRKMPVLVSKLRIPLPFLADKHIRTKLLTGKGWDEASAAVSFVPCVTITEYTEEEAFNTIEE
jgi:hypothetical protein